MDGKEDILGDDNKDAFDDDAAGDSDGKATDPCDGLQKVVTILADPGIGGNIALSKFQWEDTRGMEDLVTDAVLRGSQIFIDGRVGDIGNGGISSVGEESAGHDPDNDGHDN